MPAFWDLDHALPKALVAIGGDMERLLLLLLGWESVPRPVMRSTARLLNARRQSTRAVRLDEPCGLRLSHRLKVTVPNPSVRYLTLWRDRLNESACLVRRLLSHQHLIKGSGVTLTTLRRSVTPA